MTQLSKRRASSPPGLHKRLGATVAVDGVDLEIAPGEVVALLGPNGGGKSTTIDMLLGRHPPEHLHPDGRTVPVGPVPSFVNGGSGCGR